VSGRIVDEKHEEARRKRLGLKPGDGDIDRRRLAITMLSDRPLELEIHEREFIARLLDPKLVAAIFKKKKKRGRPKSTAAVLLADQIAETYFESRAIWPDEKHKQGILPDVAKFYGVSPSYVDKVLRKLDPTRRAELISFAASVAEKYRAWVASPQGIEYMQQAEITQRRRDQRGTPKPVIW
jgi:hypothetical protein